MIEDEIMYFLGIYINRKYSFFYLKKGKVLGSVCHYSGYPNCTESLDSPLRLLIIVIFPGPPLEQTEILPPCKLWVRHGIYMTRYQMVLHQNSPCLLSPSPASPCDWPPALTCPRCSSSACFWCFSSESFQRTWLVHRDPTLISFQGLS